MSHQAENARPTPRRATNRRGEGDRLRTALLAAAMHWVETQDAPLTLRGVAREVGIAATSVYLHFPDLDHLLAAVVQEGFEQLAAVTSEAAEGLADPAEELRRRCRAYCHFGLEHPRLYGAMFQTGLPLPVSAPAQTPGLKSFQNLVGAVRRCIEADLAPADEDPFRLGSLIWTAEHGLVSARISRPTFPWAPIDDLVYEMVNRMMGWELGGASLEIGRDK